jgi:hypothetical protein
MRQRHLLSFLGLSLVAVLANCTTASPPDASQSQSGAVSANDDDRVLATLKLTSYSDQMRVLAASGHDIAGVDLNAGEVDVIVDETTLDDLRAQGYQVVRIRHPNQEAQAADLSNYQTPDKITTALKGYADRFPALAQMSTVGQSVQNRAIHALRITKDVATPHAPKPVLLLNGMHHARELMTAEVTLDAIDYLLTKYGTDAKVTHWVDANEIWVLPMLNVDGNAQVWAHDKMWRKNTHGCAATTVSCQSGSGVDINRNYPYNFAGCQGSSSNPGADDYHGPSAGSEPETQALMKLVAQIRPVFDISYHSYSEVVLYPTGCENTHAGWGRAVFEDIGKKMGAALPSDDGVHTYQAGTPWELLYGVDGDDFDWMYTAYGVNGFGIEVNSAQAGFQPSYSQWRDKTVQKTRPAWQMLLDRLDASGIRATVHTASGSLDGVAYTLASSAAGTTTRPVNPDGTLHVVVMPGDYDLTITGAGGATTTQHVTVGATRVDLDLSL